MAQKEQGGFGKPKEYPAALLPEKRRDLMLQAIENLQQIERDSVGRDWVEIPIYHNDPIQVISVSDLHIGALATNNKSIERLVNYVLSKKNVRVVLLGDEIEGIKKEYLDTNRTPLDLQAQIDLLRLLCLEPLSEAGVIDAMVSGYWGHPGWAQDATTINIWSTMTQGLNIPILKNGGELRYRFYNGRTQTLRIRHNPPGGNKVDPVSGLRMAELALSESARTSGAMSGHIHTMATAKEWYFGAKASVFYISAGTEKGSHEDTPADRYGEKLAGKPLCDPLGQGVILQAETGKYNPRTQQRDKRNYPYPSFAHGKVAFEALTLLNAAERQGLTDELKEKIWKKERAPIKSYSPETSRLSRTLFEQKPAAMGTVDKKEVVNQYSKMKMLAPFDSLTFNIQTRLPITLHLDQDARIGSSGDAETIKGLTEHMRMIQENPHSFVVFLRSMIDKEAGSSPERIKILENFVNVINGAKEQTLAIMFDSSMRKRAWKGTVGPEYEHLPVAPASYVASRTGKFLIHHLSLIKLAIGPSESIKGKPMYIGAFTDKMMGSGSFAQPTFGLKQTYNKFMQEKPGYIAGGHMPSAGTMTFFDRSNAETHYPILVHPGWWAKYVDTMGQGNVVTGAQPGQAIIFMPGEKPEDYLAFPTADADETEYMQNALMLQKGLEILGLTNKVLKKTK